MKRMKVVVGHLPGGITCRQAEEFIDRYLDGELSSFQKLIFKTHIAMCKECHEYLRAYEASRSIAKIAMSKDGEEADPMPDDLVKAILAAQ